jgi:hypothetical protein
MTNCSSGFRFRVISPCGVGFTADVSEILTAIFSKDTMLSLLF